MNDIKELTGWISAGRNQELESGLRANPKLANEKTEQGISLLQFAVYCRNKNAIDLLRPMSSLDVFEAASLGELLVVQNELKRSPHLINAFAPDGFTALGLSCFFGHRHVAEHLLINGADPNIASRNSFHVAPIHSACAISSLEITELLIKHGANVNAKQQQGITPLHETTHNGKMELTRLLLDHGAAANVKTENGQTPLDMALEKGFSDVAEWLRQWGDKSHFNSRNIDLNLE